VYKSVYELGVLYYVEPDGCNGHYNSQNWGLQEKLDRTHKIKSHYPSLFLGFDIRIPLRVTIVKGLSAFQFMLRIAVVETI
jgi:hypothetical protein